MSIVFEKNKKLSPLVINHSVAPRLDIQALRGIAVLLVVFYHAKIGSIPSGYLGVDIFFVVSGFLITRLVASEIAQGNFSLKRFYFKRAKRLLPAAYVTFAVTAVLAPWFLNQQELRDFSFQLIGAITFTGNFILWQQTGYFQGASELKPLLHMWSLAIEEQYYFVLPALLLLTRHKRWLPGAVLLLVVSLVLCVGVGAVKPIATFYLLPTRAWELLIGSVGALWMLRASAKTHNNFEKLNQFYLLPALVALLVLPFIQVVGNHPGLNAVLICIATLVVLVCKSPVIASSAMTRFFARFGDMSYSLYLVHWPIIAFIKNSWVGDGAQVPFSLRFISVGLSFVFAFALYRLVENPIRKSNFNFSWALLSKGALCSLFLISITPIIISSQSQAIDYKEARKPNFGFSELCEYKESFEPKEACRSSGTPTLMVWGDSFAMHLVPGLMDQWKAGGMIQATKSQCGPFLDLAPKDSVKPETGTFKNQMWAQSCIEFNRSVVEYLRHTPSVKIVVLSSPISQYIPKENVEHVIYRDSVYIAAPADRSVVLDALSRTVNEIRSMGKKVVLVAPPPSADFNIGGCLERKLSSAVAFGGRENCVIDRLEYQKIHAGVLDVLKRAEHEAHVAVIRFDRWLCEESVCKTLLDGTMIYRDGGHLSYAGSKLMAQRMDMARLIAEGAE